MWVFLLDLISVGAPYIVPALAVGAAVAYVGTRYVNRNAVNQQLVQDEATARELDRVLNPEQHLEMDEEAALRLMLALDQEERDERAAADLGGLLNPVLPRVLRDDQIDQRVIDESFAIAQEDNFTTGEPVAETENQKRLDGLKVLAENIPDEFLCGISTFVMDTPVYDKHNPKERFDSNQILRWLKTNAINPLTRTPLSAENLIVDTELKAKIETFIKKAEGPKQDVDSEIDDELRVAIALSLQNEEPESQISEGNNNNANENSSVNEREIMIVKRQLNFMLGIPAEQVQDCIAALQSQQHWKNPTDAIKAYEDSATEYSAQGLLAFIQQAPKPPAIVTAYRNAVVNSNLDTDLAHQPNNNQQDRSNLSLK